MQINRKGTSMFLSLILIPATGSLGSQALAAESGEQSQTIYKAGTQESFTGPADYFTGNVEGQRLFPSNDTAHFSGAYVTFKPGARSAWHTHPAGQHIVVTDGVGRTQVWSGPVEEIKAGDVIWCPPGVKHWHGASPDTAMTHLVVTSELDGNNVEWMEQVGDAQYHGE
jgi:quercetin dioxygenase-like cupin family protein